MIPVKDNIPRERFPFVTVILIATTLLAYALSRPGGLLSLVGLWLASRACFGVVGLV